MTDPARRRHPHDRRGAGGPALRRRRRCRAGATRTLTGRRAGSTSTASPSSATTPARWPACPARPTLFTGQYPDVHGVTQTDGLGKVADDSPHALAAARARCRRWALVPGRAATTPTTTASGTSATPTCIDPPTGGALATNDDDGEVDPAAVQAYLDADPLDAVRVLGLGRARAARRGPGQQRPAPRPAHRRPAWWPGWRTATPAAGPATPTRCARSCSSPAS